MPGGRINEEENWKESLQREVKEEVGINKIQIVGIVDVDTWYRGKQAYSGITFRFVIEL